MRALLLVGSAALALAAPAPATPPDEVPRLTRDAVLAEWQELDPGRTAYPWEGDIVLLWHPMWDRGVTAGYFDGEDQEWRGLSHEGWFAFGIPPTHWMPLPAAPAIRARSTDTPHG